MHVGYRLLYQVLFHSLIYDMLCQHLVITSTALLSHLLESAGNQKLTGGRHQAGILTGRDSLACVEMTGQHLAVQPLQDFQSNLLERLLQLGPWYRSLVESDESLQVNSCMYACAQMLMRWGIAIVLHC